MRKCECNRVFIFVAVLCCVHGRFGALQSGVLGQGAQLRLPVGTFATKTHACACIATGDDSLLHLLTTRTYFDDASRSPRPPAKPKPFLDIVQNLRIVGLTSTSSAASSRYRSRTGGLTTGSPTSTAASTRSGEQPKQRVFVQQFRPSRPCTLTMLSCRTKHAEKRS